MRLSPVLEELQTYPFVRLAEARRRLQAAGVDLLDFGVGEPREETPAFIRAAVGIDAVNFGPGDPAFAHTRDEQVRVEALVESFRTLERFACA